MRFRRLLPAAALALAAACATSSVPASDPAGYVGVRHPPVPDGVEELAGSVIGGIDFRYAIAHVRDATGGMLWLQRLLHHDAQGIAHFEVVAVQPLPAIREGEGLVIGSCREGDASGGGDGLTTAVVRWEEREVLTGVRHAWRADPEEGRFVALDAGRVQCLNEALS